MTTRDRNRVALESDALGAASLGVGGVLCVSGDHQSLGICPAAASACDMDSIQLTQAIRRMVDRSEGFDGRRMNSAPKLVLGATAQPYLQPAELGMLRLGKKIASGAQFLLTQAVVSRIAGAPDARAQGAAICAEVAGQLKGLPGLAGIHILCGGCEDLAGQVIQQAGLGRA